LGDFEIYQDRAYRFYQISDPELKEKFFKAYSKDPPVMEIRGWDGERKLKVEVELQFLEVAQDDTPVLEVVAIRRTPNERRRSKYDWHESASRDQRIKRNQLIRAEWAEGASAVHLAKKHGLSERHIRKICARDDGANAA
jgi:hypothetical protein